MTNKDIKAFAYGALGMTIILTIIIGGTLLVVNFPWVGIPALIIIAGGAISVAYSE